MLAQRRSPLVHNVVIPITLLALLSGCYKWSTPGQSPVDFIRDKEPSQVKLHLKDGRQLVVHDPSVTNGDISAFVNDTLRTVPFDEVSYLEHRSINALGIVGVVTAIGLFALVVGYAVECSANPDSFFC